MCKYLQNLILRLHFVEYLDRRIGYKLASNPADLINGESMR